MLGAVLAGGKGERLKPLSSETPKPFIKLAGKPLYRYSVEELERAGVDEVVVVTREEWLHRVEGVKAVPQKGPGFDSAFRTAVEYAAERSHETVLVALTGFLAAPRGISVYALDFYSSSGYSIVMSVVPVVTGLETYGFVDMEPSGRVKRMYDPFDVKKVPQAPGYVFAGVVVGSVSALRRASETGGFIGLVNSLAQDGVVGGVVWGGDWVEVGYPWDLLAAQRVVLKLAGHIISPEAEVARSAALTGQVSMPGKAVIEENAVVEGPVYIGRGARVEAGAVVKGPAVIEAGAIIGPNSVVKGSLVMESARVGAGCVIESSIIGEGAAIGPLSVFAAGRPVRLPQRLRPVVEGVGADIELGVIVAPREHVKPHTVESEGKVIGDH
ncbi:NTP transferase domain-containing protein [Stetteria hydrogenophila]